MGHQKAVATLLIALLAGSGCASMRWTVQKAFRSPGERLESFPEEVWAEYDCETQKRPFFMVESNELVPPRVSAGAEFGHRMVYVMCPVHSTEVVEGRLSTRIRYRGEPIVDDTVDGYAIKPGRWVIDAFVQLPPNADPGVYAYEVAFESTTVEFAKSLTFVVGEP